MHLHAEIPNSHFGYIVTARPTEAAALHRHAASFLFYYLVRKKAISLSNASLDPKRATYSSKAFRAAL